MDCQQEMEGALEQLSLPAVKYEVKGVVWNDVHLFKEIERGDHVYYYKTPYYHHAIVADLDPEEQTLTVIGWSLSQREIVRCQIKLEFGTYFGYSVSRANYTKGCYDADLVIQRALTRVGEKDYNIVTNFARGFPDWCKTGRGRLTYSSSKADHKYLRRLRGI